MNSSLRKNKRSNRKKLNLYQLLFSNFQTKLTHLSEPSSECDTRQECNYDMT